LDRNVEQYVADPDDHITIHPRGLPGDILHEEGVYTYARAINMRLPEGEEGDDARLPPFAPFRTASDNDNLHLLPATTEKRALLYLVDLEDDSKQKKRQNKLIIEQAKIKAKLLKEYKRKEALRLAEENKDMPPVEEIPPLEEDVPELEPEPEPENVEEPVDSEVPEEPEPPEPEVIEPEPEVEPEPEPEPEPEADVVPEPEPEPEPEADVVPEPEPEAETPFPPLTLGVPLPRPESPKPRSLTETVEQSKVDSIKSTIQPPSVVPKSSYLPKEIPQRKPRRRIVTSELFNPLDHRTLIGAEQLLTANKHK
jgi:hypothetical protein